MLHQTSLAIVSPLPSFVRHVVLTSFSFNRFRGTIGFGQSHAVLNIGVGSLCGFLCVRFLCDLLCRAPLGVGTRLACGAAQGYGVAATTVAKTRATSVNLILATFVRVDLVLLIVENWEAKVSKCGCGILHF